MMALNRRSVFCRASTDRLEGGSMDFTLTPEQTSFRDEVRSWLEKNLPKDWDNRMRVGADVSMRTRHYRTGARPIMDAVPPSWRRQIGEVLIGSLPGTAITPEIRSLAREFSLGGVILFTRNIEAAEQVAELSHDVQSLSTGMPLWVGVVPRQLQSRQHQQAMPPPRTFRLPADLGQVLGVDGGRDHPSVAHDAAGDAARRTRHARRDRRRQPAQDHPRSSANGVQPASGGGEWVSDRKRPGNRDVPLHLSSQLGSVSGASHKHGGLG